MSKITLDDVLHYELDEMERMTEEEAHLAFGPLQCHACHAPIREASGGRWFGGEPYCLRCAERSRG